MSPDQNQDQKSTISFPCKFPIKVMGPATEEFERAVLTIIRQHVTNITEGALKANTSKKGNYLALTITIQAQSKEQLDNIYRDLTAHELVIMAF